MYGNIKVKSRIGLALDPVRAERSGNGGRCFRPRSPVEHDRGVLPKFLPVTEKLVTPQPTRAGGFEFTLTGPPGSYRVQVTSDFATWTDLEAVVNINGTVTFTDLSATERPWSFYRVIRVEAED